MSAIQKPVGNTGTDVALQQVGSRASCRILMVVPRRLRDVLGGLIHEYKTAAWPRANRFFGTLRPSLLAGFLVIVPSEHTSDRNCRQGSITKAGPATPAGCSSRPPIIGQRPST